MARIRTIKPSFWDHEQLGRASALARLTFAGLISQADDEGRGKADPDWLWGRLHAYAPPALKASWKRTLSELEALKDDDGPLVVFYKVADASYYWLPAFCNQQYIEKPSKSTLPAPPNSGNGPLAVRDTSPLEGKGREGIGKERRGGEGFPSFLPSAGTPEGTEKPQSPPPTERGPEVGIDDVVSAYARRDPSVPSGKVRLEVSRALRLGIPLPQVLSDVEAQGERMKIWTIVDNYQHPSRKNVNGKGHGRENQPTERPAVLAERREVIQKRQDDARARADQMLAEMDPDELRGWTADAKASADASKLPDGLGRDMFIKAALRKRAAEAFSIEGV